MVMVVVVVVVVILVVVRGANRKFTGYCILYSILEVDTAMRCWKYNFRNSPKDRYMRLKLKNIE